MKVLFAGPSVVGLRIPSDIHLREPAVQGEVTRATVEGVTAIGLIDGRFEDVASVWHKEILFALSEGVHVCGAASMGALRAAECRAFGMVGVGAIYGRYSAGELDDDAAVAQLHGPAELDHFGLTEPLVNVEATLIALRDRGAFTAREAEDLLASATMLNFKDRTYERIIAKAPGLSSERRAEIALAINKGKVDLKRRDAKALIDHLTEIPDLRGSSPEWHFFQTVHFQSVLARISGMPSH